MGADFSRISRAASHGFRTDFVRRNMLRIKALGSLTIVGDSGPLMGAAAQPRRLAVLALLARAGGRGMTRDKIAAHIWPDADEERARTNLSKVLYAVRRDLGSDDVVVGAKDLRLNPEVVATDLADFEGAVAEGDLERAAGVYEGPFLDGFRLPGLSEFDHWVDAERAALRRDYEAVLEKLARRAAEHGDRESAVRWWRTLASLDPLNARHAIGLMHALDAAGERAGALQHARIYESLVQQELDLPPDRDVVALAQRLRGAPPALPGPSPAASTPEPVASVANPLAVAPPMVDTTDTAPLEQQPAAPATDMLASRRGRPLRRTAMVAAVVLAGFGAVLIAIRARSTLARGTAIPVLALGRITDYRASTGTDLARPLTDMLATSLGRLSGARVVSTARMYELLSQAGSPGGDTSAAALVAAARRAGATELVDGALYALDGGRLQLDLRRMELATGRLRATHSISGRSLIELVDSGTARLASDLRTAVPPGSIGDVTTQSMAAYRLYEQGLRAYYQRDLLAAERFFDAALVEDSTFAMAAYYGALTAQFDHPRMVARLARAERLAAHATERERLTILAQAAYARDDPSLAAIAESLVVRHPQEVEGYFFLGVSLADGGAFLDAIPPLDRAVAMDSLAFSGARPRCVACDALQATISAYMQADSLAAVEREARRWLRLQPRSGAAWRALGDVFQQRGDSAHAIEARRREAELNPNPTSVLGELIDIATYKIYAGDYDQAEQFLLDRVKGVVPAQEAEAHWFLAVTYRQQGRLAEALPRARRYRAIFGRAGPANTAPQEALHEAQVLFEMGRYAASAALFDSIARWWRTVDEVPARRSRYQAWAMTHAANALAALGDTARLAIRADSVRELGTATRFGRDRRLHHHVRGLLLAARGRDDEAIAEFRQAINSPNTGYTRVNYELARAYLRRGRPGDAIAVLQPAFRGSIEASNLYVTRTELHEVLAQAWDALGANGARDSAATHWAAVVHAWRRADPMFAERARHAASRLAALSGR
jgi:DNA-binding SARP family transcriptional activator